MGLLFDPAQRRRGRHRNRALAALERDLSCSAALFLIRALAQQRLPCLLAIDQPPALPLGQLKAVLRDAPLTLLALSSQLRAGGEYACHSRPEFEPARSAERQKLSGQMQVTLECERGDWRRETGRSGWFQQRIALNLPSLFAFSASPLGLRHPAGGSMFSALVIWDLAATIEGLHQPGLVARPLVVVCGEHQLKVLATDERAREAGVRVGDSRKQAEWLCPDAAILRARDEVYRRLFAEVSADLAHHIDKVEPCYHPGLAWWYVQTTLTSAELEGPCASGFAVNWGGRVTIGTGSGNIPGAGGRGERGGALPGGARPGGGFSGALARRGCCR